MYVLHNSLIRSPDGGHLGCFQFRTVAFFHMCFDELMLPQLFGIYLSVELLVHRGWVLALVVTTCQFSKLVVPVYTLQSIGKFQLLHILTNTDTVFLTKATLVGR